MEYSNNKPTNNNQNNNKYEQKEAKSFQTMEESLHWISFNLKKIKELLEQKPF